MTSRWYLLPLVQIAFVLGFLLVPHAGGGDPAANQVELADSPVSGGDWSLGAVRALPILHGPSVADAERALRTRALAVRAQARARRTTAARRAAARRTSPSTPVRTATPTPAANAPPPPTSTPPASTPPPAKPAPAPATQNPGPTFDSTGSSTFDSVR